MVGLVLAVLWAGWQVLQGNTDFGSVYMVATTFLNQWYFWTTVAIAGVAMLIVSAFVLVGAVIGAEEGGKIGAVLGVLFGGAFSIVVLLFFAIRSACSIFGSALLVQALVSPPGAPAVFDPPKLFLGSVLIAVAILLGRSSHVSLSYRSGE